MGYIIVDIGASSFPASTFAGTRVKGSSLKQFCDEDDVAYLFEPLPEYHKKLEWRWGYDDRVHLYDIALSNEVGETTFFVPNSGGWRSSLLKPLKYGKFKEIKVKTDTLDNVLGHLDKVDYMKLDTQGSEYEILEGGGELLKKTKYVKCEVEFIELYKNQKLYDDIVSLMESYGFDLADLDTSSSKAGDAFFINTNTELYENGVVGFNNKMDIPRRNSKFKTKWNQDE